MVGRVWWSGTVPVISGWKQRKGNGSNLMTFLFVPFYSNYASSPVGWCSPHSGRVITTQLIFSENALQIYPEECLTNFLGNSKSKQVSRQD